MEKKSTYPNLRFSAETLRKAHDFTKTTGERDAEANGRSCRAFGKMNVVAPDGTEHGYDTIDEFLAAYRNANDNADTTFVCHADELKLFLVFFDGRSVVTAEGTRSFVTKIFEILDEGKATATKVPSSFDETEQIPLKIFIGHGRNPAWMSLRDHLRDYHKYHVEYYEVDPHAGHMNPEVVQRTIRKCSFGLLVFTGEDAMVDGKFRARQNVVHELGLVTSHVGPDRAIILFENGTEEFSNVSGVQQIRFDPGQIRSTFGDVLAVIKREFGS